MDRLQPLLLGADAPPTEGRSPARFGGKSIGFMASIALTVNNISGAGMLSFPQMFQRAGLLPSLAALALVCVLSTLFATMLSDTIARVPGNTGFSRRIEFSDLFHRFIGPRTALLTQAVFYLNLLSQNLAAIVACAQMFDSFAGSFYPGATYAVRVSPSPVSLVSWEPSACKGPHSVSMGRCVPFADEGDGAMLVSAGYVATTLVLAPLGLMTLEENMAQQKVSFVALFTLTAQFLFTFATSGSGHDVPWVGESWIDAVGVVIFNFAFCVTVPSWLNEKAPSVSVNRVFWTATVTSTLLYAAVGYLGARAFADAPENMLSMLLSPRVGLPTRLCATLFGVLIVGLGVPIFCVMMRYNLVNGGLCGEPWAHVWSSAVPFGTAWMLYQGNVMLKLLAYSGIVLNGFIDFLMPGLVTLVSLGAAHRTLQAAAGEAPHAPVQPLPARLLPHYRNIILGMDACLAVLLPLGFWLQLQSDRAADADGLT